MLFMAVDSKSIKLFFNDAKSLFHSFSSDSLKNKI
jgi:hypothetical protein